MKEIINMTQKELNRLDVIKKILEKRIKQKEAAIMLNLSIRQIKRLCKSYKELGTKGLISKKRGKISNNRLNQKLKDKIVEIILKNYRDFGPTLAYEKLIELHSLKISLTSVRNIMILYNIWIPKKIKRKKIYQMRERRSCFGELIQIDGSPLIGLKQEDLNVLYLDLLMMLRGR